MSIGKFFMIAAGAAILIATVELFVPAQSVNAPAPVSDQADAENTPTTPTDPPSDPNMMDMPTSQVLAKQNLASMLKDADSAEYQGVQAYRKSTGGKTMFVFCGQVNAKNSFGAFDGYSRFVATPVASTLEGQSADFGQSWQFFCTGEGTVVAF
jgi:hypothetical protein